MSSKVPYKRTLQVVIAASVLGADLSTVIGSAPFDGNITSVKFIPNALITGANTNTRRHAVTNRGQGGAGTTEAAALQYNSGVNAAKWAPKAITLIADPADDVLAGDVLTFDSTHIGTGIADPGGVVIVELTRTAGAA